MFPRYVHFNGGNLLSTLASRLSQVVALTAIIVAVTAGNAAAQTMPDRGGFTFFVNGGLGIQNDAALEETAVGISGINFGVGGFLTKDLAIVGRYSGTAVSHETPVGDINQISGVFAPTLQYWASDKMYLEGGVGAGVWNAEGDSNQGLGLILGAGFTMWNRGKHNLQVGFEYAPAFTDPGTVHNFGITIGYQLF
jgi:hypothetical protein